MTSKIKTAFDGIKAEDSLKINTLSFLYDHIQEKGKPCGYFSLRRVAIVLASLIVIIAGAFSYNLYFTESAYVDLDVNPSIELTVNRFDRVIGAYAYNADGADILDGININHKKYSDAVEIVIDTMAQKGFITDYGLVSVTLQTDNGHKESEMLLNIESAVQYHHEAVNISAFLVDSDTKNTSHDLDLTPAKYLAILELQEVDPTVTIESCRGHTIREIYQLTEEHTGGHHGGDVQTESANGSSNAEHDRNCGHGKNSGGHH